VRRLRSLSEDECYARCYRGSEATVVVSKLPPRPTRYPGAVSGEELRRIFEERLDSRVDDQLDDAA
jgi:hypothetical protein